MTDPAMEPTVDLPVNPDELQLFLWERREDGLATPEIRLQAQRRFPHVGKDIIDEALNELDELRSLEEELLGGKEQHDKIVPLQSFAGYEIRAVDRDSIHCGGLSSVHAALDTRFGRRVAIKVPLQRFVADKDVCQRVEREANLCARLQHPNIVPIYDVGVYEPADCPYFVMKYVAGVTLGEKIDTDGLGMEHRLRHLRIVRVVAQTLAHAHSCLIIHRDLKPDNVMVGEFGEVHLLDWGLARDCREPDAKLSSRQRALERFSQTSPGGVLGTLAYMAPEQALGRVDLHTAKTDVFGIGAMLCFVLTGSPLYSGKWTHVLADAKRCRTEPTFERLRDQQAPEALITLAQRCLDPNPEQRPTMHEVDDCLGAYIDGLEQAAISAERKARWAVSLLAATLLSVMASVGGFVIQRQYNERLETERAVLAAAEARASALLDSLEQMRSDWTATEAVSTSPVAASEITRLLRRLDMIEADLTPASGFPRISERIRGLRNGLRQDQSYVETRRRQSMAESEREQRSLQLVKSLRQSLDFSETLYQQQLLGCTLPSKYADIAYPDIAQPQRLAAFARFGIDWQMSTVDAVAAELNRLKPDRAREVLVHLWLWQRSETASGNETLAVRIRTVIQALQSDRQPGMANLWQADVAPTLGESSDIDVMNKLEQLATPEAALLCVAAQLDRGEEPDAMAVSSRVAGDYPANPLVLAVLGHLWSEHATRTNDEQSNFYAALATEYLRGWKAVSPKSGTLLAQRYLAAERLPEAIILLKASLWIEGFRNVHPVLLGLAHAKQGETDAALKQLAGLPRDDAYSHWQTLSETILLADLRRFDQAEVGLATARRGDPHLLQLITGLVSVKQGRRVDAQRALEGLLNHPDLGSAAEHWLKELPEPSANAATETP